MIRSLNRSTLLATLAVAVAYTTFSPAADDAKPDGGNLAPLKYEIPKAMFIGTPKNIKASATLEPYSEKPPAPLMIPSGCTNLAAKKKVTSSDQAPIIGELSLVTDGDKDGSDGSFVELRRASSGSRSTWSSRPTSRPSWSGITIRKAVSIMRSSRNRRRPRIHQRREDCFQ